MTESEWLVCDDPLAMAVHLHGGLLDFCSHGIDERKARLFLCTCARAGLPLLPNDPRTRDRALAAIVASERYADDSCSQHLDAMTRAHMIFDRDLEATVPRNLDWGYAAAWLVAWASFTDVVGNVGAALGWDTDVRLIRERDRAVWADLLREIFGNPFFDMAGEALGMPAGADAGLVSMARAAYENLGPDGVIDSFRLWLLADALEDLGCVAEGVLEHLRQPTPHVRGCWALDLVLGLPAPLKAAATS